MADHIDAIPSSQGPKHPRRSRYSLINTTTSITTNAGGAKRKSSYSLSEAEVKVKHSKVSKVEDNLGQSTPSRETESRGQGQGTRSRRIKGILDQPSSSSQSSEEEESSGHYQKREKKKRGGEEEEEEEQKAKDPIASRLRQLPGRVSVSCTTSSSSLDLDSSKSRGRSQSLKHKTSRSRKNKEEDKVVAHRRLTRSATATSEEQSTSTPSSPHQEQSQSHKESSTSEERYRDRLRSRASSLKEKKLKTDKQGKVASGHDSQGNTGGEEEGGRKGRSFWRRGGTRGASSTTNNSTTGSCASSRCGRGAGGPPKSTEDPVVKAGGGEQGMNNSSNTNNNPSSSTKSGDRVVDRGGESGTSASTSAATGSSASGASATASAFSRGLAMLTGDGGDGDDSEMGRLQALLESRGLPPHLFGSLAPRMQQLLHRGMSASSGNVTKAQQLLQGLQSTGDEGQQLQAAIEMCQLLVMGNEDTLAGFPIKQTVTALIQLLSMEHNFDMMNHASRALTYMMEALPRSTPAVAEAIPVFLEKLLVIQCMDVAEQSLTALEMLSRRHAKAILQAKGVGTTLTFLDFFSIVAQRAALSITANCMQNLHIEEFPLVGDSLGFLASRLTQQDKKSVESVCLAFSRLIDSMISDRQRLEEIASTELLANLQQLLVVTPPIVSTATFILVLRMLAHLCSRCPSVAVKLLEQNIVGTLSSLLLGSSVAKPTEEVELVKRNPQELLEIINLIAELLPKLPKDGIFVINHMISTPPSSTQDAVQWQWKDDRGQWNSYSAFDSRIIEAAHQSGEDEISLSMHGGAYTVDILGMQQINEDTGTARTVQRKVNPFFGVKSDGTLDTSETDERAGYLAEHADFALQFLRPLFALMNEANSSSAGPAVRTSCLKTLLRVVHFVPAESLEKTLKPQPISNTLASMLGSSDLKIVIGAFQLCCLFMDKLHDHFYVHFKREGVFHQISHISTSEVVTPSPVKGESTSLLGTSSSYGDNAGLLNLAGSSSSFSLLSTPASPGPESGKNNVSKNMSPYSISNSNPLSLPMSLFSSVPIPVLNMNVPPTLPPITTPYSQAQPQPPHQNASYVGGFFMQQQSGSPTTRKDPDTGGSNPNQPSSESGSGAAGAVATVNVVGASKTGKGEVLPVGAEGGSDVKKEEIFDPCKRKRVSKRGIPTSTPRRHRHEDATPPPSGSGASGSSGTPSTSGSTKQSGKRHSKSGFFASFHPSRWTTGSSSSNNNFSSNSSANNNPASKALSRPYYSMSSVSGSSSDGTIFHPATPYTPHHMTASYTGQMKTWLKEQTVAFTEKYCHSSTSDGGENDSGKMDDMTVMPKLNEIIDNLQKDNKIMEALRDLRAVVLESDVSSFEINQSGLISALTTFFTDDKMYTTNRDIRIRSFLHVFADCPLDYLNGDKLDNHVVLGATSEPKFNALCSLISKLHSCLSQLEQFEVRVHELPSHSSTSRSTAPTSALRFFNTHQLKCNLQRHPSCNTLRQWKGGPVKIDSLALVQTIERYLIAKGFARIRESRDSGDSDDDNSDDEMDDTLASNAITQGSGRHKIQFLIGDNVLPYTMTVYQAIRQYGYNGNDIIEQDSDFDPSAALLASSSIWSQTHVIYYRPVPEEVGGVAGTSCGSSSVWSSSSKKKNKLKSCSKSKKDSSWNEGQVPDPVPPYNAFLTPNLPDGVGFTDPCFPVLNLLRIVHAVCRYWRYFYWPVYKTQPLLPASEFINTKVAAKAQRLVQDPVVILAGTVPQWLQQIGVHCPFLFPFETRHMLFYSITFDRDRALQRLLDSVPELNGAEREDRIIPRLDRRKRTISRENMLQHAEQLMNDFGSSRPLLEIQYENEVGTGLGPTLEFYALVSQEMQKKELDLWHSEDDMPETTKRKAEVSFVHNNSGLFPKPIGKSAKASQLSKVKNKFKFLGKFMAKALMDSRLIDLPLSKAMCKWMLNEETSLTLSDIADVDSTIARSIRQLVNVACEKKRVEKEKGVDLHTGLESLTLDGCKIESLGLDFTVPGHPSIDLKKGGRHIVVSIHNLEEYIKLVCHWMLVGGIQRQMESWREGFDSVFSSLTLKIFYPEELDMVFCGANQTVNEHWDYKTLVESCRPDHGYTIDSKAIQFLFQLMSTFNHKERRSFLQFVTGSPRLPVGGFKVLQPQLTIVRKTVDDTPEKTDQCLPSVMTCVNYLKLPDYSTIEIMRERLRVAMDEGQLSFYLS